MNGIMSPVSEISLLNSSYMEENFSSYVLLTDSFFSWCGQECFWQTDSAVCNKVDRRPVLTGRKTLQTKVPVSSPTFDAWSWWVCPGVITKPNTNTVVNHRPPHDCPLSSSSFPSLLLFSDKISPCGPRMDSGAALCHRLTSSRELYHICLLWQPWK